MKNLKKLDRSTIKSIFAGKEGNENDPACYCGGLPPIITRCGCIAFCDGTCK
ncbi:hypothetical protein [Chryseobacterium sp. G0186]|uniref:hypothetical protein n=1 Tax=Chryseobacterium sp. G0186 TaxID=2487064 RepID=UPI0013DDD65D|nr:hypothetical protein [Chryseobacterium sp. G0186]